MNPHTSQQIMMMEAAAFVRDDALNFTYRKDLRVLID